MNSVMYKIIKDLGKVLNYAKDDNEVRVVVITENGDSLSSSMGLTNHSAMNMQEICLINL